MTEAGAAKSPPWQGLAHWAVSDRAVALDDAVGVEARPLEVAVDVRGEDVGAERSARPQPSSVAKPRWGAVAR
jgi:hypothetical protein